MPRNSLKLNMLKGSCRLCLATFSASPTSVVMCFGPAISTSSAGNNKYTVAEVLVKHFWFELHSERDADAYVCVPCWTKVDDFHQFYQSVLVLYQDRWQPPKREQDAAVVANIDGKLEITITEDDRNPACDELPPSDFSDDEEMDRHGGYDGMEESIHRLDIKKEENSDTEEPIVGDSKQQRTRTRSSNASTVETIPDRKIKVPVIAKSTSDSLIATYFTLKCDLCNEPLANLTIARQHHQQQHKQRGYLSCGCGRRFTRIDSIREHCAFHDDPSPHKCEECCRIYASAGKLSTHNKYSHPPAAEDRVEPEPDKSGGKKEAYNSLANQRRGDELIRRYIPLVCDLCGASYESFAEARAHHRVVHNQIGYVECCGKRFVKKSRAVWHCVWHENPRQMDCTICGRNFVSTANLRDHMIRFHGGSAPFAHACNQCDSRFQLPQELRRHKQSVHLAVDERRYECFSCHRRFVYLSHLRAHQRVASNTGPTFVCDVCAKCFKSKHTYTHHYAVEHGSVSLKSQCPECGKWLKHPEAVARHRKQHRSLPCTCELCGNVLANSRALNSHRRLVHGKATHKCLVCDKMFKKPLRLREHMAMHTGVTDLYTCAYCPKTFRSNANMYKHRRQVHAAQFEVDRQAAKLAEDERNAEEAAMARLEMGTSLR